MIRAVLDSNILISAAIKRGGAPDRVLRLATVRYEWLACEYILSEVAEVFKRDHLQRKYQAQVTPEKVARFLRLIQTTATIVQVRSDIDPMTADRKDDPILACAVDGNAGYLVTNDQHLLRVTGYRGIHILTPEPFLDVLSGSTGDR